MTYMNTLLYGGICGQGSLDENNSRHNIVTYQLEVQVTIMYSVERGVVMHFVVISRDGAMCVSVKVGMRLCVLM